MRSLISFVLLGCLLPGFAAADPRTPAEALRAERDRLRAMVTQQEALLRERARLKATLDGLQTARGPFGSKALDRIQTTCQVQMDMRFKTAETRGALRIQPVELGIGAPSAGAFFCVAEALLARGDVRLDVLMVTIPEVAAEGHLAITALESIRPPAPVVEAAPSAPMSAGPDAPPEDQMIAREIALLWRMVVRQAGLKAEHDALTQQLAGMNAVVENAGPAWMVPVVAHLRTAPIFSSHIDLRPASASVAGMVPTATERDAIRALAWPASVEVQTDHIRLASDFEPELALVHDTGDAVEIFAADAPADAIAQVLGMQLLTTRTSPLFSGRIRAGSNAAALSALVKAVPSLKAVAIDAVKGTGKAVSFDVQHADSRQLTRILAKESGQPLKSACAASVPVSLRVSQAPADGLHALIESTIAADPRCKTPSPEKEDPGGHSSRLSAMLRIKGRPVAVFVRATGRAEVVIDRMGDRFTRFQRAHLIMPERGLFMVRPIGPESPPAR